MIAPSSDHVRARGLRRPAERIELFDPAARGFGSCRVTSDMKTPAPPSRSLSELRELTPARVGLGRAGASLPTEALLDIHARSRARPRRRSCRFRCARASLPDLTGLGLQPIEVSSQAREPARLSAPSRSRTHARCRLRGACWRSQRGSADASSRSSSATACRRRRSMRMRWNWFAVSCRGLTAAGCDRPRRGRDRARGSRWATRSAPCSARAWS